MNCDETFLESVDQYGCGLRITFAWHRDRYAHAVALVDNGRLRPLLASLEGNDADVWPPSPPLQNLTIEDRAGGHRVALLVGMAGKSHWSASIETTGANAGFLVDVACRVKDAPASLGSAYRTMAAATRTAGAAQATMENEFCLDAACDLEITPSNLVVRPHHPPLDPPATVRWKYQLSRTSSLTKPAAG